jgi:hypothetical protein
VDELCQGLQTLHQTQRQPHPQHDERAFEFLAKGEVDSFIDYFENNPVNLHVNDLTGINLLVVAQDVANDTNAYKKALSQEERNARAIKASLYLIEKGIDINYRYKNGGQLCSLQCIGKTMMLQSC